jgi:glycosyltransferase involved in cell wall biosynthesis
MNQWEKYGINGNEMRVAHDAVNMKKFNATLSKDEARRRLKINIEQPIVAYTGSLLPGKGVDVLVKCASRLPGVSFIIVGGREDQIRNLKQQVRYNNVIFAGYVEPAQIPAYQSAADILVLPNTKGGVIDDVTSPMKLFEYMASGRPIIATNVPSLMEILSNDYNALICQAGDDVELSEKIDQLCKSPTVGERLVKNAIKDIEKYTWDARAEHLSELFNRTKRRISARY